MFGTTVNMQNARQHPASTAGAVDDCFCEWYLRKKIAKTVCAMFVTSKFWSIQNEAFTVQFILHSKYLISWVNLMTAQGWWMKHTEKDNEWKLDHFKYYIRKRVDKITVIYVIFITCFQQYYERTFWYPSLIFETIVKHCLFRTCHWV